MEFRKSANRLTPTEDAPTRKSSGRVGVAALFIILALLAGAGAGIYVGDGSSVQMGFKKALIDIGLGEMFGLLDCPLDAPAVAAEAEPGKERKVLYWVDPMNPTMKSDKPGKAPCGMDLVPVYDEEKAVSSEKTDTPPEGSIRLGPRKQQIIGVKLGEVTERSLSKTIRTVGRVTYDETGISHVHTKFSGWIDEVFVNFTGKPVKKGQPLISVYSPELVSAQQELLIARKSRDSLRDSPFEGIATGAASLYRSSKDRLRLWDVSEAQIREIEKRNAPLRAITLNSSINGFVLTKNAFPGQQVSPEMELYTIADLSTIWVLADVYEYEAPMIQIGQAVVMTLPYYPGKTFTGKVSYVYPELDRTTRTLKVRIELANPDLLMKPDMYANVEIGIDYGKKLAAPVEAVLDSGDVKTVFVAGADGYFEPRRVTLGQKVDDLYIILDGLKPGERIVTSANFFIDSESQLKSAVDGMAGGVHAGHGVPADGGGKEKPGTSPDEKVVGPAVSQDHSGHGEKQGAEADGGQSPSGSKKPTAAKPLDHSGHGR